MKKKIKKFLHNFYKGAYAVGYRHVNDKATHFDNTQPFEAVDFPYKWELQSVLYDGIAVVDTVFVKTEDNIMYAVGQKLPEKKNVLFKIDTNTWKA